MADYWSGPMPTGMTSSLAGVMHPKPRWALDVRWAQAGSRLPLTRSAATVHFPSGLASRWSTTERWRRTLVEGDLCAGLLRSGRVVTEPQLPSLAVFLELGQATA